MRRSTLFRAGRSGIVKIGEIACSEGLRPYREVVANLLRRPVRALRGPASRTVVQRVGVRRGLPAADDAVALTFDDGPDPDHAPAFLDELRRLGIVATFFVVGHRARAHPELVRRARDEGHAVGSHSDTHPDPWTLPLRALSRDYRRGRRAAEAALGRRVPRFRPPKGYVDGTGAAAMLGAANRAQAIMNAIRAGLIKGTSQHQV